MVTQGAGSRARGVQHETGELSPDERASRSVDHGAAAPERRFATAKTHAPPALALQPMMAQDENIKGETTAFCVFAPFKSWEDRLYSWFVMKGGPVATEEIRRRRFLHFMSFMRISPKSLKRAQLPHRGPLASGALVFISAFNGQAKVYVRGFSEHLGPQMDLLWRGCAGWTGPAVRELDMFVDGYSRRADFHFNAYPDTSHNLRVALRLRAELDELVALALHEPSRFLDGYRRAAQTVWGAALGGGLST